MRADAEVIELTLWREQVAIVFSSVPQVLDHQEIEETARVNAEPAPCIALKQIARQHYELTASLHRAPPAFNASSQSVSAMGGTWTSTVSPPRLRRCARS